MLPYKAINLSQPILCRLTKHSTYCVLSCVSIHSIQLVSANRESLYKAYNLSQPITCVDTGQLCGGGGPVAELLAVARSTAAHDEARSGGEPLVEPTAPAASPCLHRAVAWDEGGGGVAGGDASGHQGVSQGRHTGLPQTPSTTSSLVRHWLINHVYLMLKPQHTNRVNNAHVVCNSCVNHV